MYKFDYRDFKSESYFKDENLGYIPFYPIDKVCPFCKSETKSALSEGKIVFDPEEKDTDKDEHHFVEALVCICGWWSVRHVKTENAHNLYSLPSIINYKRGKLHEFDQPNEEPLRILREEIIKNHKKIDLINPTRMEKLVGSILADLYTDSEIKHVGKTNDGGMDLFGVLGNDKLAVQVKTHDIITRGESVKSIREFIGVLMTNKIPSGIFVTTANHFSKYSKETAKKILQRDDVNRFDLIDRYALIEMIKETNKTEPEPWRKHIPGYFL